MKTSGEEDLGGNILREIASMTGGQYFTSSDKSALRRVYEEIDKIEKSRIKATDIGTRSAFLPFGLIAFFTLLTEIGLANTLLRRLP
jgi:Ca-activated chloride channel family protein